MCTAILPDNEVQPYPGCGERTELDSYTGLVKHAGWHGKVRQVFAQLDTIDPTVAITKDDSIVAIPRMLPSLVPLTATSLTCTR